jgi:protease PrsW
MTYPIYLIILAIAPGLIWLFYFFKRDVHPEPKRTVLKIFFYGMLAALPAALAERGFQYIIPKDILFTNIWQNYLFIFLTVVIGVALAEELAKYLVVRIEVMRSPEFDEPVDVMLYMIIAALGFATLENIFIFLSPEIFLYTFEETLALASFRFVSATFLHALASGTIGFFLALSFCEIRWKKILALSGFAVAVLLHGLYNFSIMKLEGRLQYGIPIIILVSLAIFIFFGIKRLKKIKSICKI